MEANAGIILGDRDLDSLHRHLCHVLGLLPSTAYKGSGDYLVLNDTNLVSLDRAFIEANFQPGPYVRDWHQFPLDLASVTVYGSSEYARSYQYDRAESWTFSHEGKDIEKQISISDGDVRYLTFLYNAKDVVVEGFESIPTIHFLQGSLLGWQEFPAMLRSLQRFYTVFGLMTMQPAADLFYRVNFGWTDPNHSPPSVEIPSALSQSISALSLNLSSYAGKLQADLGSVASSCDISNVWNNSVIIDQLKSLVDSFADYDDSDETATDLVFNPGLAPPRSRVCGQPVLNCHKDHIKHLCRQRCRYFTCTNVSSDTVDCSKLGVCPPARFPYDPEKSRIYRINTLCSRACFELNNLTCVWNF